MLLRRLAAVAAAALLSTALTVPASAAPKTVPGPGALPQCFAPWNQDTKFFKWDAHQGPFRIALVNGFVGNIWRIQMIQTAKAFAALPDVAKDIKEFKVISTGTDAAAQLGAIEDFINQGFDAIVVNAVSPTGFDRVIKLANRKNVVLVPFDNVLDTTEVMQVNEDQTAMGVNSAKFLIENVPNGGKILEVRGLPGNSVDRDRHDGFQKTMKDSGKPYDIVEVVGNWAPGDSQKATADALAVHGHFDGIFTQGGSNGTVQALLDAKQPLVPMAGEGENLFRQQIAQYKDQGLKGYSYGQSPALVAIAMKAAIAALKGETMPQMVSIPIPVADYKTLKDGENYWSNLTVDFFAPNAFEPCGITFTAPQIMAQNAENK
ncbi:sugar ABC transporter substrate-binding protein [Inquilinus limosus]|uniref:Ribose ABC transporter substrate-binding protein n=1 Tax=Inquilinus limosus TaxID=171674 RepID=A0A211ZHY8_9PROT|nr:sugar ABC transporter substrate-binding protein [Inquilinus limosus]OWJ64891.1 ribose ABC transporter substrate-binding protein [Inquilinus limosus]